jgi:hypothetical protein
MAREARGVKHSDLVAAALLTLNRVGAAWGNNTGALKDATGRVVRYGLIGSSDIIACIKGRFVGVECKVGRDRLSEQQHRFRAWIDRNQGLTIVLHAGADECPLEAAERLVPLLQAEGLA